MASVYETDRTGVAMSNFIDQVGDIDDYSNMPKFELQQRAILGDEKAERIYLERYGKE
jgi:hypothetical protein